MGSPGPWWNVTQHCLSTRSKTPSHSPQASSAALPFSTTPPPSPDCFRNPLCHQLHQPHLSLALCDFPLLPAAAHRTLSFCPSVILVSYSRPSLNLLTSWL